MTTFVKNAWYVAAWSRDIRRQLTARTILGEDIVPFRQQNGKPAALLDRCPHKLAPLSAGELKGDKVACGYHGLTFDCSGKCVRVPGQTAIPPDAVVRSFPLEERYGAVWIWMGEPALADPSRIVAVEHYGDPACGLVDGQYLHFATNYLNITDNLVDPAHTTYVHKNTIGNAAGEEVGVKVKQGESHVLAYRWIRNAEPLPLARLMGNFGALTDRWQYYYLHMPSISCVDFGTTDAGVCADDRPCDLGMRSFSYNFLTPETETTTHYFWLHVRNYHPLDRHIDADIADLMTLTFKEDQAILALIQRQQEKCGEREFVKLAIDNAPARIRRMVSRLIAAETRQAETPQAVLP